MKKRLSAVFALLMLLCAGCAAVRQEEKVTVSKTDYASKAVSQWIKSGELPGIISVFYKNGVQETACLGYAHVTEKRPISLQNIFMQCSQTKGFCGVTIAILLEEGKISLDDPVSKYLPEFKNLKVAVPLPVKKNDKVKGKKQRTKYKIVPAKNVLTIRMVMNHTGGFAFEIPTKRRKGWSGYPLRATAKEAAATPLRFEPGTRALYSNTGIDIGAAIVEVVTGKPWDVFLKERVLDPLGMKNTTFKPSDEQLKDYIAMYVVKKGQKARYRHFSGAMPRPYNGPNVHPSAGAGLWTTAEDQLKFYKMLMNLGKGVNGVRILKEETVKKYLAASTRVRKLGSYSMGLTVGRDGWFGHGGAWGTSCMVNWKTKQLRLCVVQINGARFWNKALGKAANQFFAAKLDNKALEAYTGRTK